MQVFQIYSVRDSKTETFHQPFLQKTHGEAERTFQVQANDPQSQVARFPTDFELWHLGEFDDSTGKMALNPAPKHIITAINLVKKDQPGLTAVQ